jgi:hypothetical protein
MQGVRAAASLLHDGSNILSEKVTRQRKELCKWCSDTIHRHLCLMDRVCHGVITEARLQNVTVGLLYLLRNGIVVHDMVVLPKIKVRHPFFFV